MENKISRNELTGFRVPTSEETSMIQFTLLKRLERNRRVLKIMFIIMICLIIGLANGLYDELHAGSFSGTAGADTVIGIICILIVVITQKQILKNKLFIDAIQNGKFEVIDCTAYDAELIQDMSLACASVSINVGEKFIKEDFVLELSSPSEWKNVKDMNLLLMKCNIGVECKYELFRNKNS